MSDALDIRDIQTLRDLQSALGRFAEGAQGSLRTIEREIARTQEWLAERVQHWHREKERGKNRLEQAASDLRRCEASGYRDQDGYYHEPDCSREIQIVRLAKEHLRECEENLETAQAWRSHVDQAVAEYQREARRLSDLASEHTKKAQASLVRTAAKYEEVKAAANALEGLAGPVAAAGIQLLRTMVGQANIRIGTIGEYLAQKITEEELGLEAMKFDQAKHGFDQVLQGPNGQIIVLESKTNSEGKLDLGEGYGYRQASSDWVEHIAHEMTNPSSELYSPDNAHIGQQILDLGPENIPVLATVINPNTGTADIYLRGDSAADSWTLLADDASLDGINRH